MRWLTNAKAEAASTFREAGLAAFRGLTGFIYGRRGNEKRFIFPRFDGVLDCLHHFHDLPMGSHMTNRKEAIDRLIAQDADLIDAPTQTDALKIARETLQGWRATYQLAPPHPDIAPDLWQNMIDRTAAALAALEQTT